MMPIRDKLIKNIQPFTPKGSESGTFNTFAKGIRNAVNGSDQYNANFIAETEKLLGTKIGNNATKNAIAKLSAGEKKAVLAKIEKETKLLDAKLAKDQELKNLTAKEREVVRKSRLRILIKKTLRNLSYVVGGEEILRHL